MKKYDNYVSNLRVLERADREALDNEFIIGGIIDSNFPHLKWDSYIEKSIL